VYEVIIAAAGADAGEGGPTAAVPVLGQRLGRAAVAVEPVVAPGPYIVGPQRDHFAEDIGPAADVRAGHQRPSRAVPMQGHGPRRAGAAVVIIADGPDAVGGDGGLPAQDV